MNCALRWPSFAVVVGLAHPPLPEFFFLICKSKGNLWYSTIQGIPKGVLRLTRCNASATRGASERVQADTAPKENVTSWIHISGHADRNRYYT